MKPIILLATIGCCMAISLFFSGYNRAALHEPDAIRIAEDSLIGKSKHWLALQGMVRVSKGDASSYALDSAQVYVKNETDSIVLGGLTDHRGRLAFRLPLNRVFSIHITRAGFVEKKILIDTKVPAGDEKIASFTFDIDIFPMVNGLDVSILDKPISKINFRPYTKEFVYDATYTHKINGDLKKMYRDYFAIEKAANDSVAKLNGPKKKDTPKKSSGKYKYTPR